MSFTMVEPYLFEQDYIGTFGVIPIYFGWIILLINVIGTVVRLVRT